MIINRFSKFSLFCIALFAAIAVDGQCIWSQLLTNAHSNTAHTITINNPINGNNQSLYPPLGTYTLNLNYDDDFSNPITQSSTTATVTVSSATQFVITDNSITFPTITSSGYDFPHTLGSASLVGAGGSYSWTWNNDQMLNCSPLPVTLISFNGQVYNYTNINLAWLTADEYSLSSYIVQRSSDGINWNSIGQVTPFNTGGNHNYYYTDCAPSHNHNYYRLKMLNTSGSFTYSNVIHINCVDCTGIPPGGNCGQITISGPSTLCNWGVYTLSGVSSCQTNATWSISPSYLATISPNFLSATAVSTGNGNVTISATVPGCSNVYTKTVYSGAPPITTSNSYIGYAAYTQYYVSISNPDGSPSEYTWYNNGYNMGTGYSKYFYAYPNSPVGYSVSRYTQCGTSTAYGYLEYQPIPGCLPQYILKQTSESDVIIVNRVDPCGGGGPYLTSSSNSNGKSQNVPMTDDYELRLMDFQGTIKKDVNHVSLKNTYNLDVSNVMPGNYVVQILSNGVIQFTKKLRIE